MDNRKFKVSRNTSGKLKRIVAKLLLTTVMVNTFPLQTAQAAEHVHTDACYEGEKHVHDESCEGWGSGNSCQKCNGAGRICPDCNGTHEIHPLCTGSIYRIEGTAGIVEEYNNRCTSCGYSSKTTRYLAQCDECSEVFTIYSVNSCYCGSGRHDDPILAPIMGYGGKQGIAHYAYYTTCNCTNAVKCDFCNGTGNYISRRTCVSCNGSYSTAGCSYCESGKIITSIDSSKCTVDNCVIYLVNTATTSDQYHNVTTATYKYECKNCGAYIRHTVGGGSSISGSVSVNSLESMSNDHLSESLTLDLSNPDNHFEYLSHFSTGSTCLYCEGSGKAYCAKCNLGTQFLTDKCSLSDTSYYYSDGSISQPICNKVVTSVSPVAGTQTINAGQTPNFKLNVTYLDGHTTQIMGSPIGYSATNYGVKQTVTLNVGEYSGTAKNKTPMQSTMYVTVNGYFKLSLNNDASKGTVSGANNSVLTGTQVTVSATPKPGYEFVGWYNGDTLVSSSKSTVITMPANDYTLTASYKEAKYSVSFDSNGGNSCSAITVTYKGTYGALPTPTRIGYTFNGWYLGSNKITSSSQVTSTFNHTLKASWTADSFNLTFDSAGGTPCTGKTVTFDSQYGDLPTPVKTGYDFRGWWFNSMGVNSDTIVFINYSHTLTAKWEAQTYDLYFNSNFGSSCSAKRVTYNSTYGALPTPTRDGYTFLGWYYGDTKIESTTTVTATQRHTLSAKWKANTYKITIIDFNGNETKELSFLCDATASISAGIKPASWFTKWVVVSGDGSAISPIDGNTSFRMPPCDLILRANWNDVVSIRSEFSDNLNSVYGDVYDAGRNSYNIDQAPSNKITVTKDMLNVWVVFEDGTTKRVTDVAEYSLTGDVITTIGSSNVVVTLNSITKADGSPFECYSVINTYSASVSNIMEELGITTYQELAEYISELQGSFRDAVTTITKYDEALERYRLLLNDFEGNDIEFDEDLVSNLGRIEQGIQTVLDEVAAYNSNLVAIQNAIIDAGGDLGDGFDIQDGDMTTILSQISRLKIEINNLNEECNSLHTFCDDLKSLLQLDEDASLDEIKEAIIDLKESLRRTEEELNDANSIVNNILSEGFGDPNSDDSLTDKLQYLHDGLEGGRVSLSYLNQEAKSLLNKLSVIKEGSSSADTSYEVSTLEQGLWDLMTYMSELNARVDETQRDINELKEMLGLAVDASFEDIKHAVSDLKSDLANAETELRDVTNIVNEMQSDIFDSPDTAETLIDRLLTSSSEIRVIKDNLASLNEELIKLLGRTDAVINGTTDDNLQYQSTTIQTELRDLEQYIENLKDDTKETEDMILSLKTLLGLAEDSSLQEIYDKVEEFKGRMEKAELEVSQYEDTLEGIYDKLGSTPSSEENLQDYLDNCLVGLDETKDSIVLIDKDIQSLIERIEVKVDGEASQPTAVSGSALQVTVKDLEDDVKTLNDYVDSVLAFAKRVADLFGIPDDESATLDGIINSLTTVKQEYDMYIEMIERLESLISAGNIEESDLASQLSALYDRIDSLKKELESTDNMLDNEFGGDKDINDIRDEIQTLKSDLSSALETISQLQANNLSKDTIISELNQRVDSLENVITTKDREIADLKAEIEKLRSQNSVLSSSVSSTVSNLNNKLTAKDTEIESLRNEIKTIKEDKSSAELKISDLTSKLEEKEIDVKELETDKQTLKDKVDVLESKVTELEEENVKLEDKVTYSKDESISNSSEISRLQKENRESALEIEKLKAELESLPVEDISKEYLEKLRTESTNKDLEIQSLRQEVSTLKSTNNSTVTILKGTVNALSKELDELKQSTPSVVEIDELKEKLQVANGEVSKLSVENEKLQGSVTNLQTSRDSAVEKYKELINFITEYKNESALNQPVGDSNYAVDEASRYSGIYLSNDSDKLRGIDDRVTSGNRVIYIDTWNTSDGMLLSEDGYMLSFFTDYAWGNSLDIFKSNRNDTPSVLNDVMLYEINMATGEYVTFVIQEVNYTP